MSDNALYWGGRTSSSDRLWAVLAHVSVFAGLPFVGPLVIYLLSQRRVYIRYHASQALALHLVLVLIGALGFFTCGLGFLIGAIGAVIPIYGAFKAFSGDWSGYPLIGDLGKE